MKKQYKKTVVFLIFLVLLVFNTSLFAQSSFEGKIIYSISYSDIPAEMKGYESMMPKDMIITMKGSKSRIEQSQMMGKNIVINDMEKQTGFIEMDMGGQKLRINISTKEFNKKEENIPSEIEYTAETKTILGYACKKAIMKNDAGNTLITLFYTDKIKNHAQKKFLGLKGFPLQYTMTQQNMTFEMTATELIKQSVPDSLFEKSDGYKDITQADMQKMMGGIKF